MASPTQRGFLVIAAIAVIAVAWLMVSSREAGPATDAKPTPSQSAQAPQERASQPGAPSGVATGAQATSTATAPASSPAPALAKNPADPIGSVPPVRGDLNPQTASVVEALKDHTHPERLSTLIQPPPFDAEAFRRDPAAYINVVQPGRVFQTAQPGPQTPVLHPLTPTQVSITQDGQAILRVISQPLSPVSFTTFDLGRFGNSLTAQTVIADATGVASVTFSAGPGTIDAVHVLAGSPVASGQVAFDIQVAPAQHAQK
jgi:hypothetical protein